MAKQSGLGDQLFVGGYDLGGDIQSINNLHGGPAPLDVTGIKVSAFERIGGVRDGEAELVAYFNDAPLAAHPVLSPLPRTDVDIMYFRGASAVGGAVACLRAKQITYDGTRAQDGAFTFGVSAQANGYGIEWATGLTAGQRSESAATNGTSVDFGTGSTAFGLQAWLQVFAITSGTATIKLQQSSDNGGADAFADVTGGGFTAVTTAPGTQRIETARGQTVERYLRVVTTGTFSGLVFAVAVARNDVSVVF